jgi:hypothetical protein
MTTREDLEQLPTKELHERAITRAKHHVDVGFLWELVKALPVAKGVIATTIEQDRHRAAARVDQRPVRRRRG